MAKLQHSLTRVADAGPADRGRRQATRTASDTVLAGASRIKVLKLAQDPAQPKIGRQRGQIEKRSAPLAQRDDPGHFRQVRSESGEPDGLRLSMPAPMLRRLA